MICLESVPLKRTYLSEFAEGYAPAVFRGVILIDANVALELLKSIRARPQFAKVPVLMLSFPPQEAERHRGLSVTAFRLRPANEREFSELITWLNASYVDALCLRKSA